MKNISPLVSIGICIFRVEYLRSLFKKLEDQTYLQIEFIFSIDNPSDNIIELVNNFNLKDKKNIKIFINKVPLGAIRNHNFCLSKATGEYFIRIDDDDEPHDKYYIENLVNHAAKGYDFVLPRVDVVNGNKQIVKKNITNVYYKCTNPKQFVSAFFNESAMIYYSLFKTEKLKEISVNKNFDYHYVEGILNFKAALYFKGSYCIESILLYRIHKNNLSVTGEPEDYINDFNYYNWELLKIIIALKNKNISLVYLINKLFVNYIYHMKDLVLAYIKKKSNKGIKAVDRFF